MPFTPNHQQKVNECYPKKEGEGTNSGKLSSLIYYINARPQKLVKVATYISVKVVKDVQKQKDPYNEVTLDILDSIMKNCSGFFESFCPYALIILFHLLQTPSYGLGLRALRTFSEFCARSKNIINSIQSDEFFKNLHDLTLYFARLCTRRAQNEIAKAVDVWQNFGFDGLRLVLELEDYRSEFGSKRVRVIIDAIWCILRNYSEILPNSGISPQNDANVLPEPGMRSIQTLAVLFKNTTATSLPIVLDSLFDISERNGWSPKALCMFFFGSAALNVPQQYIFVVLSTIFKHLESMRFNEVGFTAAFFCIYEILLHNRGPLGFSSLELAKNLVAHTRILAANAAVSLPVILTAADFQKLPEPLFVSCNCIIAVTHYSAFMTQRFDILTYILRKTFRQNDSDPLGNGAADSQFSDRHSVTTDSFGPTTFLFFQLIWIIIAASFVDPPKLSKFSKIQVPSALFDRLIGILSIEDKDIVANSLYSLLNILNSNFTSSREILESDRGFGRLDYFLLKIAYCLSNEAGLLPAFVLSYRILKATTKISKSHWFRVISFIRSLRRDVQSTDASRAGYCTFMECLLIQFYCSNYTRLDSLEYKKMVAEISDCNVYEELFEQADIGVLNQSFGQTSFEFELDQTVIDKIYTNTKSFSAEELGQIIENFTPTFYEKNLKVKHHESRQLQSFQDSFRSRNSKQADMSSRRSFLSLNIGSSSSKSIKINSPKTYSAIMSNDDLLGTHVSEVSIDESSPNLNILSAEFDSLSMQAKADKSSKSIRRTMLE